MTFLWPELVWLQAFLPILIAAYVLALRRRRKAALLYATVGLVKQAMSAGQRVRRHVPAAILFLALAALLLATARPATVLTLPARYETVILALDVSGSMAATDVAPDRLTAAQVAAKSFIQRQPRTTRIGVVAFSGGASLVQPATRDREDILAAIDRLQPQGATAIGHAILVSLKAIFPDLETDINGSAKTPALKPVPPGSYGSAVIVLLTDGQNTIHPDSVEAAKTAAERGVRVYTVGFGTTEGTILHFNGWSMRVRLDEEPLKQVAAITQAEYFNAVTGADLNRIYETLTTRFTMERRETEITAFFSSAGALLVLLSAALSLAWFQRVF